ncbi:MAG: endonuclease/exonuclease/phosphatase family protein [Candidatus Altiarchaeia archaeon]
MKIVGWNCSGGYRNKAAKILETTPDIVVVSECESKVRSSFTSPERCLWFGDEIKNPSKGLAVISYSDYLLETHDCYNPSFRYVVPIKVKGKTNFNLIAVWTKNDNFYEYIGQFWLAIKHYEQLLDEKPIVIVGDLNWCALFDKKYKSSAWFAPSMQLLKNKGITSAYHNFNKKEYGEEQEMTFCHRSSGKTYHIDYCFASDDMMAKLKNFEIGEFDQWKKYSDHMPIIAEFDL